MKPQWITPGLPALVLAPMEGVTDAPMRALMTEMGGFSFCVSEFLRISQDVLPPRTYFEHVPEFAQGCRTPAGLPIQIQLLGGNAQKLAESAVRACELGAEGIDLNFGCPARTVNRHDGGASLLKSPHRIREIVAAVRAAVPRELPVSAKIRLGWESIDEVFVNAEQAALGGAAWLTIHARTRLQGYQPPVFWERIGQVRERLRIPVVANGDIWTIEDFRRCREITGAEHYMIGRGALANPTLPRLIARELGILTPDADVSAKCGPTPAEWLPVVRRFVAINAPTSLEKQNGVARRIKQWLRFPHDRARLDWYDDLKRGQSLTDVMAVLER